MKVNLSEKFRPENVDEVVGQKHILGEGKLLRALIEKKSLTNIIFYGPPGTGKTTLVKVITKNIDKKIYYLNATYSKTQDIRIVEEELNTLMGINGVVVVIDEIHNFTKKQQQLLLEHVEKGSITLLAMTTENPYHNVYKSLISRCTVLELFPLKREDIRESIEKTIIKLKKENCEIKISEKGMVALIEAGGGDLRKSLNIMGLAFELYGIDDKILIDENLIQTVSGEKAILYDRNGDEHYDVLSAFQKSIRGSDVDAALHYLARLVKSGDMTSINRRLLVIASEDIGLAYPNAITIVKSCIDAALMLGFPEARIPLSQAVILLATSPKSNSAVMAINKAMLELENSIGIDIPQYLKDAHYQGAKELNRGDGYKYPHDYENSYVEQQYLPEKIKNSKYYFYGENKFEQLSKEYILKIKNK
ncbi:MAG: replication-associated recombination protein A [Filifactoraceae bacterium]